MDPPDHLFDTRHYIPLGARVKDPNSLESVIEIPSPHLKTPDTGGVYVAIEGIDGSGKTTVANLLVREAGKRGCNVSLVREPYYPESKKLLEESGGLDPVVEAYIFAADRLLMHAKVLLPLLREGKFVVGDRSLLASLAYQVARGAPRELVEGLNYHALRPQRAYVLDISPQQALERLKNRREKRLLFLETLQGRIREEYLNLAQKHPSLIKVIDASQPPQQIVSHIIRDLQEWGQLPCLTPR